MQKLAEICIKRPVFAAMLILALVVVGAAAYMRLGVDRFPSVDLPTVTVRVTLAGASPEEMETEVTQRIEEAVNTIEGINELRSSSGPGRSYVTVTFDLSRNIDVAAQDVRDRVANVVKNLPSEADPPQIWKADNDATPVMTVALSGPGSLRRLTELADKVVKEELERSSGVGDVSIVGGLQRSIDISLDADRLVALQLPITTVRDAVARQNNEVPGGNVTGGSQEAMLRTMGRLATPAEFMDLVVKTVNGVPICIRDIGKVTDSSKEKRSAAYLNGVPTVTLEIRRQSGANTVAVIEAAKASLDRIASQLPADVKLEIIRDQSRYIHSALHEIKLHLVLGSILASLVVLLFMRSWRSTLIAAVAIPASVISTFGMMAALHFTLNSVTMLALVLMVGVVIDDAIVVLENIFRFVEEKKMNAYDAAAAATSEIGLAVLATTLSLVVIFIPVSFMSSISGRFLYQFGITAAVAVMVSLLVSFTLTPMMSARLLRAADAGGHGTANSRRGFYALIDRVYAAMLGFSMRHRIIVACVAIGVMYTAVPLYQQVKQEYVPSDVDEAEFGIGVTAREGTSLEAMDRTMKDIAADIGSDPRVRVVLATAGGGSMNGGGIYVRIAPHEERVFSIGKLWDCLADGHPSKAFEGNYSQSDVMKDLRKKLGKYDKMRCSVRNFPSFSIGSGGSADIQFVLRGPDLQQLFAYAERLREQCPQMHIIDADTSIKLDTPQLRVQIDRQRAADLQVSAQDIGQSLRLMIGGDDQVCRFRDESMGENYDVQLRLKPSQRGDPAIIPHLYLPQASGQMIQLANIARLEMTRSPSRIERLDRQRVIGLAGTVEPGVDVALADRLEALRKAAADLGMPAAYTTTVSGRARELERTFTEFLWAFLLSIIFMYMILASQYESLVHPLTILLSLPLSVPFALLSMWLAGTTLNLYSALGILVLFGVVKKNAILQIDHMNGLRRKGMERLPAIMQANRDRLRPILMTTLALVAGMLPLALGTGPGAEERHTIAVVVIGGQSLALVLTLLVTPVAYSLFDDLGAFVHRRVGKKREKAPELVEA